MGYLLDTSVCIFFLRGKLNLDKVIKEVGLEKCYISEITVAELRFGAENSDNPLKSNKAVDVFLNGLTIIPIIENQLILVTDNIKDFKLLNGIQIENWFERT